MGIFDRKPKPLPIRAAAGGVIRGGNPAGPDAIVTRTEDWQKRVLAFADSVPEVSFAGSFFNSTLQRVHFEVEGLDEIQSSVINRQLRDIPSGRTGENMFLIGEGYLAFEYDADEEKTCWYSYGANDYLAEKNKPFKVRSDSGGWEVMPDGRKAFRVYRPNRSNWRKAWSPHIAMLDLMESMYLHQLADTAVATSRLASAGILVLPTDMPSVPIPMGGKPEQGSQEWFRELLVNAMEESVRRSDPKAAVAPLIYFANTDDAANSFKHILLERRDDAEAFAARMAAYRTRYATGADLPPEVILGLGSANHWSAWKVDQNTYTYYIAPLAQLIADALLKNFVLPLAKQLGYPTGDLRVCINSKQVVAKPDKTDAAIRLYELRAITKEAVVKYSGMDPEDIEPRDLHPGGNDDPQYTPAEQRDTTPMSTNPNTTRQAAVITESPPDLAAFTASLQETENRMNARLAAAWRKRYKKVKQGSASDDDLSAFEEAMAVLIAARVIAAARVSGVSAGDYNEVAARRAELARKRLEAAVAAAATANREVMPATLPALISSIAAGGLNDLDGVTITGDIADVGTDSLIRDTLNAGGIDYSVTYTWVRGEPNHPFPPHVLLDGRQWSLGENPDFLSASGAFSGTWYPGDHPGCQCGYKIVYQLKR